MASMINIGRELPLFPMNAGIGPRSYVQNSSYQRGILDVAKPIIEEEILEKLNIKPSVKNGVSIADFGCSTGHNSFPAMDFITQAINHIHTSAEFQVLFNDVASNDFNTLFTSLPPNRIYHATGVPGDFHGRLLPESSLHFAYSSWSLQWLAQVPEAVADRSSLAWNRGAILYPAAKSNEVGEAYLEQYGKDMEAFLESRSVEMVGGGLMALLVPGVPQVWDPQSEYTIPCDINLLGSCLMDMAKMGRLSEAKIDSFNLPYYFTTPQQLKSILDRSHNFSIERMEILDNPGKHSLPSINARTAFYRAVHERLLADHFGGEIIDELFDLYKKKLAASPVFRNPNNDKTIVILAMLKRKAD
ncbi:hypothetical protein ACS0TY_034211 [Phlomoides rotata]